MIYFLQLDLQYFIFIYFFQKATNRFFVKNDYPWPIIKSQCAHHVFVRVSVTCLLLQYVHIIGTLNLHT